MIRGTTPTLEFELPFDTSQLTEAFVTLSQNDEIVIDKPLSACKCGGNTLTVKLTQDETLQLDCTCDTEIQVRAKTLEGDALASNIIRVDTGRILKDGVI